MTSRLQAWEELERELMYLQWQGKRSFLVGHLHPLQHAGLSRRIPTKCWPALRLLVMVFALSFGLFLFRAGVRAEHSSPWLRNEASQFTAMSTIAGAAGRANRAVSDWPSSMVLLPDSEQRPTNSPWLD
jgi:hypothetical protein